jgi:hypothetical protein
MRPMVRGRFREDRADAQGEIGRQLEEDTARGKRAYDALAALECEYATQLLAEIQRPY